jgi:hypothetical protein
MSRKANQVAHQNEANDISKIAPNGTSLPTGTNPASTEPPCVSNQHKNRLVEQTNPIDSVPLNEHKQESLMNKGTEVTQHRTAKANLPRPAPRLQVIKDGDREVVSFDDTERAVARADLAKALASENVDFCAGIVMRIARATAAGDLSDENAINFVLSVVAGGKPRDELETMALTQVGIFHLVVMDAARQYFGATTTTERHIAQNDLNKAARTFSTLLLALQNQRTAATPAVTVQNVSVSDGGQAIVGNVTQQAPGGTPAAAEPPPVTIDGAALPLNDNEKEQPDDILRLRKGKGQ